MLTCRPIRWHTSSEKGLRWFRHVGATNALPFRHIYIYIYIYIYVCVSERQRNCLAGAWLSGHSVIYISDSANTRSDCFLLSVWQHIYVRFLEYGKAQRVERCQLWIHRHIEQAVDLLSLPLWALVQHEVKHNLHVI